MNALTNRPTYIDEMPDINSRLAGGLSASQPPRISLDEDRFTLIDENGAKHPTLQPSLSLDVIVVGGNPHVSRIYYEGGFNRKDTAAPAFYSDNGVAPSEGAQKPQAVTCAVCPQAEWSKVNTETGSTTPWCRTTKKIAVLVAGAGEDVFLLNIPPASLKKSWQPYINLLREQGAPMQAVITRLTMEEKVLRFNAAGWVPERLIHR